MQIAVVVNPARQTQGEQIAREAADAVPQALTMIAGPS